MGHAGQAPLLKCGSPAPNLRRSNTWGPIRRIVPPRFEASNNGAANIHTSTHYRTPFIKSSRSLIYGCVESLHLQPSTTQPSTSMSAPHPLCPLSGAEIKAAAQVIQTAWPASVSLRFKVVTLSEPAKGELAPYLDAKDKGLSATQPDRRAFLAYYIRGTV